MDKEQKYNHHTAHEINDNNSVHALENSLQSFASEILKLQDGKRLMSPDASSLFNMRSWKDFVRKDACVFISS